jgi:hypothetical protein
VRPDEACAAEDQYVERPLTCDALLFYIRGGNGW